MNLTKNYSKQIQQIAELNDLVSLLKKAPTIVVKVEILDLLPVVQEYLKQPSIIQKSISDLPIDRQYAIKSVIAIGQAPIIFNMQNSGEDCFERFDEILRHLLELERFYQFLGGIIGYHVTVLTMIAEQNNAVISKDTNFIHPEGMQLDHDTIEIRSAVKWGIENLSKIAEILPLGGAGDRLNLTDEKSSTPLPAAMLSFLGRSLLEGIIRDHQAREYLYYKLYGKQLITPIAMMTSSEKNNHMHILNICQNNNWFGRPQDSFFFFIQPLVPVITTDGNWSLSAPLTLTLKPGGHGVIWKLAQNQGVFDWLNSKGYHKSLVRQINNPIAGTDLALLALMGIGCKKNKAFGFISCERLLNAAEGTNVLIEKQISNAYEYCLTNIEYTDFARQGIGETPATPGSPYSKFPTNTNIIFADIPSIQRAIQTCPIPGQIINIKNKFPYIDSNGHLSYKEGGRLESTMQNIADCFCKSFSKKPKMSELHDSLPTFILNNPRIKTISTTKKTYKDGESPLGTPEQAYFDLLINNLHLLQSLCKFNLPSQESLDIYLKKGPNCIFLHHPALGPLYSIIAQKLRNGRLHPGSELQLEIAEVDIEELDLKGSLIIEVKTPMGHKDTKSHLLYGGEGRCRLHNVQVNNKGIDRSESNCYWKNKIEHHEKLHIILEEGAEFEAKDVKFEGHLVFEVPKKCRLKITQDSDGHIVEELEHIIKPSWQWKYSFDDENNIKLRIEG
ncbi:MAG: UTP--glucose-1-phosphate uridylyltransferase [Parachlamydiaceae bacterium]|nr:UTP--glucose-1-phosphate uridylyltransferase [Parachlamydiaceae bacterium]